MDAYDKFRDGIIGKYNDLLNPAKQSTSFTINISKILGGRDCKKFNEIDMSLIDFINEVYKMDKINNERYSESLIVALFFPVLFRNTNNPKELENKNVREGLVNDIRNALDLLNDVNLTLDSELDYSKTGNVIAHLTKIIEQNFEKYFSKSYNDYYSISSFGNYFGQGPIMYNDEPVIYMNDNCEFYEDEEFSDEKFVKDEHLDDYITKKFPNKGKRHRRNSSVRITGNNTLDELAEESKRAEGRGGGGSFNLGFGRKLYRGKRGGVYYKKRGKRVYVKV